MSKLLIRAVSPNEERFSIRVTSVDSDMGYEILPSKVDTVVELDDTMEWVVKGEATGRDALTLGRRPTEQLMTIRKGNKADINMDDSIAQLQRKPL